MAYRLERDEAPADGARRVARERLAAAAAALRDADDPAEGVHDARKALKEARALLRLVRDELDTGGGGGTYRRENRALRDVGRRLAEARDAEVLVATVDAVAERFEAPLDDGAFAAARAAFEARRREAAARLDADGVATDAAAAIDAAAGRVADWRLEDRDDAVPSGLRRAYARGREAFAEAYEAGSADAFHAWRKRVKDLWYHLRLLEGAWPEGLGGVVAEQHALADRLGDDHDLAVLLGALDPPPEGVGAAEVEALQALARRRSASLRRDARPLAARLYAEAPAAFEARLGAYWRAWRA